MYTTNYNKNYNKEDFRKNLKRGDIVYVDLGKTLGSEQGGIRPVIIFQNNIGNRHSPTVIVASITSQLNKAKLPTHVELSNYKKYGLEKYSTVLVEQVRTIDKKRIISYIGRVDDEAMDDIDKALIISGGLIDKHEEELKYMVSKIKTIDIAITTCMSKGISANNLQEEIKTINMMITKLNYKSKQYRINIKYDCQYEKYLMRDISSFREMVG